MSMSRWIIKHIFDGDYGYEELAPGDKSMVTVTLVRIATELISVADLVVP